MFLLLTGTEMSGAEVGEGGERKKKMEKLKRKIEILVNCCAMHNIKCQCRFPRLKI